jgi:hypothetical protein
MPYLPALNVDTDGAPVVLVVGFRPQLGLTHQLMALLPLAAADRIECVLVVALANNLDCLAAR